MVEITLRYEGELHCRAIHGPSGTALSTDAPVDNMGRGESFSPTDLVATALGTCLVTTMAIVADRKEVDLRGTTVRVAKHMRTESPRRIAKLEVRVEVPLPPTHPQRELLESIGVKCPVRLSLHPDVVVEETYAWTGAES